MGLSSKRVGYQLQWIACLETLSIAGASDLDGDEVFHVNLLDFLRDHENLLTLEISTFPSPAHIAALPTCLVSLAAHRLPADTPTHDPKDILPAIRDFTETSIRTKIYKVPNLADVTLRDGVAFDTKKFPAEAEVWDQLGAVGLEVKLSEEKTYLLTRMGTRWDL